MYDSGQRCHSSEKISEYVSANEISSPPGNEFQRETNIHREHHELELKGLIQPPSPQQQEKNDNSGKHGLSLK